MAFSLTLSNSDTNYLEVVVKGSFPQDCTPFQMPDACGGSPGYPQVCPIWLCLNQEFP